MHRVTYTRHGEFVTEFASNESFQLRQFLMWLESNEIAYNIFEGRAHLNERGELITLWTEKHEQEKELQRQ